MSALIRKSLRLVLFLFWTLLASFLLLEGALRVVGYASANIYDPIYMPYEGSDEIPYVHRPDLRDARGRGHVRFDSDGLGLRALIGAEAPADPTVVAIVGDSVTFGEGVEHTENTYAAVLERELRDRGRSAVVKNFGVSAYSTREMAATAEVRVPTVSPDLVLMAVITHDLKPDRTPEVDRYGYHYNQQLSGWMAKDSWLKRRLRNVRTAYLARDLKSRFGGGGGNASGPGEVVLEPGLSSILRFHRHCLAQGLDHRIVLLPELSPVRSAVLRDALLDAGVPCIDLAAIRDEFELEDYCASRGDRHPSAAVHARIGAELAKHLAREGLPNNR